MKKLFIIVSLTFFTLGAQAGFGSFFKSVVNFFQKIPIIGNLVENAADSIAHRKVNSQVDDLFSKAKSCSPLEMDRGQNVHYWMSQKPGLSGWQDLDKLKDNKSRYYQLGSDFSRHDKVRHCYVGCIVARETNYATAVFAGWYKELQDASDCNRNTHFSLSDQDATVGGAIAASKTSCEYFCGQKSLESATGGEILAAAQKLPGFDRSGSGGGGGREKRFQQMLK